MIDIIKETLVDCIKLIPFLLVTYLIMEYIEHKTSKKARETIKRSGKLGPIIGGLLGIFPQCGFSASAANLYAGRVITLGTLIAVFLSTSDEMLPILISERIQIDIILKILLVKLIVGILAGLIIDSILKWKNKNQNDEEMIVDICEHEHCHCEKSIVKSAIKHTLNITIFILIITFVINFVIHIIGEENLENFISDQSMLGHVIAGIIGIIPNCASSVILTKLYIDNIISVSIMISGLLVNAGLGLIILFKVNKSLKENIKILSLLYIIGVSCGIILQIVGFSI